MSRQTADSARKATSNHLNRQIGQYSLAAAVAGVSMLALAAPAAGEVVVTKKTIPIPLAPHNAPEPVEISLANNGVNNIKFELNNWTSGRDLRLYGSDPAGEVIMGGTWSAYALALNPGAEIGPADDFSARGLVEASVSDSTGRYCIGYWAPNLKGGFRGCGNLVNRYLGVRFPIDGEFHYGWIRLTVATDAQKKGPILTATITEYAYETVPNEPIYAGSTKQAPGEATAPENIQRPTGPSLGMLAAGADALPQWRQKEGLPSQ